MDFIETSGLSFSQLNETIRHAGKECRICACQGQRFIAAGMSSKRLEIDGIPGNALGAYLGGGSITVNGNAQDAVGDTMSAGRIVIHGSTGDAAGYAMRADFGARPAHRRPAGSTFLPVHRNARRKNGFPRRCEQHTVSGSGHAAQRHGGRYGGDRTLCAGVLPSV